MQKQFRRIQKTAWLMVNPIYTHKEIFQGAYLQRQRRFGQDVLQSPDRQFNTV